MKFFWYGDPRDVVRCIAFDQITTVEVIREPGTGLLDYVEINLADGQHIELHADAARFLDQLNERRYTA